MVCVFSFSLFGSENKYCKGLLKNIAIIEKEFPTWKVWVYCGDGIPEDILLQLSEHPCVKLIPTMVCGMENKFYRFFAIDDPEVEISIIRDADSRIYERDRECIKEFLASDKLVHIIRDHPNHHHRIMAGMWGIRRDAIIKNFRGNTIQSLFELWKQIEKYNDFWSDTLFLCKVIYPYVLHNSLIHDDTQNQEDPSYKSPFPIPLDPSHFIGQVYEFDESGNEIPKFKYKE